MATESDGIHSEYEEWVEKIHKAANTRPIDEEKKEEKKNISAPDQNKKSLLLGIFIFLLALVPRLYFLFFVSDPQNAGVGWYGDTYHHWQIAYLTREIGLSHGFLRLWDLKGMEFFWGLAHPFVLMTLMSITHSSDIIITRLLSLFSGTASVLLLFLIARRYWGTKVAIVAAIFGALNPISIFNDVSGSVEPLGIFFFFSSIYFWPGSPFLSGLFLTATSMSRAEFWLFALGIAFAILVFTKEHLDKKIIFSISFFVSLLLYMKYLLSYTGNPIYPLWWNFLGNAAGKWQANIPLTPTQAAVQPIWIAMFFVSLIGIIYVLWKKPEGLIIHILGLGSFLFLGAFVGMTQYIKSYAPYFWVVRIFSLPYLYLGLVVGIFLFLVIPKFLPLFAKIRVGWIFVLVILLLTQLAWNVIWDYFAPTENYWKQEVSLARDVSKVYRGGGILIHEGDPVMTYALVKYAGIKGRNIEGQMYDPFQYKPFVSYEDPFEKWGKDRKIIIDWLKRDNIKLLIFHNQRYRYLELVKREPKIFNYVEDSYFGMKIYEVKL